MMGVMQPLLRGRARALRRRIAAAALVAGCALALPASASAHIGPGAAVATDYEARVDPLGPGLRGLRAQAVDGDRKLWLQVDRGLTVTVLGYLDEPFLRFSPAGVAVNQRSPTAVDDRLAPRGGLSGAAPRSPAWRPVSGAHSYAWHDGRLRPVPATGGPARVLGAWSIPLVIGGRRAAITGESRYAPAPPLWPWLIPLATALAGSVLIVRRRCPESARRAARALAVCAVVGGITSLAGRELNDLRNGTSIQLEVIPASVLAACLLVVLVSGGPSGQRGAALIAAVLAGLEGLALISALRHGFVLSVLPADLARAAAALGLLAGAAVIAIILAEAGWDRLGHRRDDAGPAPAPAVGPPRGGDR
jgi:hypothetical protein